MTMLSVVVPTYNEAENIPELLRRIKDSLKGIDYEVVIVDDDSPDGTARVAEEEARKLGVPVRVIVRKGEKGLATAVVRGFREARGEYLVVLDADLQHPPELIPRMLEKALETGADVVVASRFVPGGGCDGLPPHRKLVSFGAKVLAYILVPRSRHVRDPMSGFFLVHRRVLEGVDLSPIGYKILLEILAKGRYAKVVEVPYRFEERKRGESKLGWKQILDYLRHVLKLFRETGEHVRFTKFALVGASGIIVNELGLYASLLAGLHYLLGGAVGFEASVLWNFTLHELWTFHDMRSGGAKGVLKRLVGYHAASITGLACQLAALALLTGLLGVHPLLANLAGIAAGFALRYSLSVAGIWSPPSPRSR